MYLPVPSNEEFLLDTNSLYNYRLYYTNNNINGNCSIILIKTADYKEKPKFITYDSIILDTDAKKEVLGNMEIRKLMKIMILILILYMI